MIIHIDRLILVELIFMWTWLIFGAVLVVGYPILWAGYIYKRLRGTHESQ